MVQARREAFDTFEEGHFYLFASLVKLLSTL